MRDLDLDLFLFLETIPAPLLDLDLDTESFCEFFSLLPDFDLLSAFSIFLLVDFCGLGDGDLLNDLDLL